MWRGCRETFRRAGLGLCRRPGPPGPPWPGAPGGATLSWAAPWPLPPWALHAGRPRRASARRPRGHHVGPAARCPGRFRCPLTCLHSAAQGQSRADQSQARRVPGGPRLVSHGHQPDLHRSPMEGAPSDGRDAALEEGEQAGIGTGLQGAAGALCDPRTHDGPARGTRRTPGSEASGRCSGRAARASRSPSLSRPSLYLREAGTSRWPGSLRHRSRGPGHTGDARREPPRTAPPVPPLAPRSDRLWATQTTNRLGGRTGKGPLGTECSRCPGDPIDGRLKMRAPVSGAAARGRRAACARRRVPPPAA